MRHVGQTNENANKVLAILFVGLIAFCKEIKNKGYTCTVYDYDKMYIFIIRRQAMKRHPLVDGNTHLIMHS